MDEHDHAKVAILGFRLDPIEQCSDLITDIRLSLIIELDKAQQERLTGIALHAMFFQRKRIRSAARAIIAGWHNARIRAVADRSIRLTRREAERDDGREAEDRRRTYVGSSCYW